MFLGVSFSDLQYPLPSAKVDFGDNVFFSYLHIREHMLTRPHCSSQTWRRTGAVGPLWSTGLLCHLCSLLQSVILLERVEAGALDLSVVVG